MRNKPARTQSSSRLRAFLLLYSCGRTRVRVGRRFAVNVPPSEDPYRPLDAPNAKNLAPRVHKLKGTERTCARLGLGCGQRTRACIHRSANAVKGRVRKAAPTECISRHLGRGASSHSCTATTALERSASALSSRSINATEGRASLTLSAML